MQNDYLTQLTHYFVLTSLITHKCCSYIGKEENTKQSTTNNEDREYYKHVQYI